MPLEVDVDVHLLDDFPLDQSGDTTSSPHHPAVFDNSLATFAATTPLFEFDSHISRRIRLVDEMLAQVYTSYVIHVRGTPMTGKSTLAQLVARRSAETSPGTTTVFITWAVLGEHGRKSNMNYQDFIVAESSGRLVHSDFLMPRAPILIIIDEAQLSYDESRFWLEFIKKQATDYRTPELRVILFSSWGSASEDVLTFQGSAPITLLETQRVESIEQSGWPHRMALAFSFEEAEELVARFLPNSWVSPEVARELVRLSNGHPGVTHGLLKCIEKAEVFFNFILVV